MNRTLHTVLGLFLLAHSSQAQQTYRILLKDMPQGSARQVESTEHTQTSRKIIGTANKVLHDQSHVTLQQASYRETILERKAGDDKPTQLRRYYFKARHHFNGTEETLPLEKQYVLIRKGRAGPYEFLLMKENKKVEGTAALWLHKEHNAVKAFDLQGSVIPKQAVGLNVEWKLDMEPMAENLSKSVGMRVDLRKASGTGRLTKVYQQGDHLFGVMVFRMEMPLVGMGEGKQAVTFGSGSAMTLEVTLSTCIDGGIGTGTLDGKFSIHANAPVTTNEGGKARMVLSITGAMKKQRQEVKPE